MPIPFQDLQELDTLGQAAFYKLEATSNPAGFRGALFQITARGEPVEFTYNRIETPSTFLWRPSDVRRTAARRLAQSLFTLCPHAPRLVFGLAEEIPLEVFSEDLEVAVPVALIAPTASSVTAVAARVEAVQMGDDLLTLFWCGTAPEPGTLERRLTEQLAARSLLLEPFARAAAGLAELYGEATPP
jgi:hypothetical protein